MKNCIECKGTGKVYVSFAGKAEQHKCPDCDGTGKSEEQEQQIEEKILNNLETIQMALNRNELIMQRLDQVLNTMNALLVESLHGRWISEGVHWYNDGLRRPGSGANTIKYVNLVRNSQTNQVNLELIEQSHSSYQNVIPGTAPLPLEYVARLV